MIIGGSGVCGWIAGSCFGLKQGERLRAIHPVTLLHAALTSGKLLMLYLHPRYFIRRCSEYSFIFASRVATFRLHISCHRMIKIDDAPIV
jgi:hypothetical protein